MITKIPKSFMQFAQKIDVIVDEDSFRNAPDGSMGWAVYRENKIYIRPRNNVSLELQTFFHELTHFVILNSESAYKNEKDGYMHSDEGFIELTSCLFHQAISTMEFEL
jgi:Zn-dependent peptidase ImmA (M78 family)